MVTDGETFSDDFTIDVELVELTAVITTDEEFADSLTVTTGATKLGLVTTSSVPPTRLPLLVVVELVTDSSAGRCDSIDIDTFTTEADEWPTVGASVEFRRRPICRLLC